MKRKVWLFLLLGVLVNMTPLLAQNEKGSGNLSESRQIPERMYGVMILEDWNPHNISIEDMRVYVDSFFHDYSQHYLDMDIESSVYIANGYIIVHFSSRWYTPRDIVDYFNRDFSDITYSICNTYYIVHATLV